MTTETDNRSHFPLAREELIMGELLLLFWHGKWLITVVTALIVGLMFGYISVSNPVYEARAVVELGKVNATYAMESIDDVIATYHSEHSVWDKRRPLPRLEEVDKLVRGGSKRHIEFIAHANDPDEAKTLLTTIITPLIEDHKTRHNEMVETMAGRIESLRRSLAIAETQGEKAGELAGRDADLLLSTPALAERAFIQYNIPQIQQLLSRVEPEYAAVRANPTRLSFEPTANPAPVKPRKVLLLFGAIVFGGLAGLFVVLMREYIRTIRFLDSDA